MTIVCFGDSITCNWNEKTYTDFWQEMLDKKYSKGKFKVINSGVNGDSAQDGYRRVIQDVIAHKPDLVTIMFGHNEIHQKITPKTYARYLRKIIEAIRKENKKTKIWLLTPNKVGNKTYWQSYKPYLKAIKELALEKKVKMVEVHKAFEGEDLDKIYTYDFNSADFQGKDFIHPNQRGQKLIAQFLMNYFKKQMC